MDNVIIKNAQGEQLNINVVRYFRLNGVEYLVFSLNEVDEGGYVKLYISKVNIGIANTITDDVEWNLIKDTIKTIIKSNKENLPLSIIDLDVKKLADVQIFDQKVFKLSETFIQLLSANKKVEPYVEPISTPEVTSMDNNHVVEEIDINSIQQNPITDLNTIPVVQEETQENIDDTTLTTVESSSVETNYQPEQSIVNDNIAQSNIEIPTTEVSSTIENNLDSLGNNSDYGLDFKVLYENELNKNKLLSEENEKYKGIINNLKNIINQTETF